MKLYCIAFDVLKLCCPQVQTWRTLAHQLGVIYEALKKTMACTLWRYRIHRQNALSNELHRFSIINHLKQ